MDLRRRFHLRRAHSTRVCWHMISLTHTPYAETAVAACGGDDDLAVALVVALEGLAGAPAVMPAVEPL